MSGIFISYRRDDTAPSAGRIYDYLRSYFGSQRVFFDRNTIPPGSDFTLQILDRVASAAAMIVVIGDRWHNIVGEDGKRRLEDPQDLVRREVLTALERGVPLFPVLVLGARFPAAEELPEEIKGLCRFNAQEVAERSFARDLDSLIEGINAALRPPAQRLYVSAIKKKVCMVGAFAVGKTSLVKQYVDSLFDEKYLTTVGVKIDKKQVIVGGRQMTLMLWDIAGEDETTPLRMSHLSGASGYILVADGLRAGTLSKANELRRRIEESVGTLPFVLAINKVDRRSEWRIDGQSVIEFGESCPVFETSAKTGQRVEAMFRDLAGRLLPDEEIE